MAFESFVDLNGWLIEATAGRLMRKSIASRCTGMQEEKLRRKTNLEHALRSAHSSPEHLHMDKINPVKWLLEGPSPTIRSII
ncbi:hypothetical protein Nepgr_022573 [Nepenthes gracilis]|uniref:Uncharacterized protein n=1 Tax=Nepenthes gracilis TaxID=150966 RepID=A0AAD3XYJ6_NEPGR|nr:hypothetical protein Nepgr_022573 [Nepenthes gracilis]